MLDSELVAQVHSGCVLEARIVIAVYSRRRIMLKLYTLEHSYATQVSAKRLPMPISGRFQPCALRLRGKLAPTFH